jgi:hypothetical protein
MAFPRGKDAQFFITDSAGTSREVSAFVTSGEGEVGAEILDTTTCGGPSFKSSIKGFLSWKGSLSGMYDQGTAATPDQWFDGLIKSSSAASTLTIWPAGSAAARQYDTGAVWFVNYKKSIPVDNVVTWSVDFELAAGSVHRGTV